jgi:hypothetical protein
MSPVEQVVTIAARATSFTAVCGTCAALEPAGAHAVRGYAGSTFAGRLDLDLGHGVFLCRRGHAIRVERSRPTAAAEAAA